MKETVQISIASIGFTLDKEAYQKLHAYLESLDTIYNDTAEGREVMSDIEARIVELILSRQDEKAVVECQLIDEIISQLGMPEEGIGVDPQDRKKTVDAAAENFPRRLYRNPDGAKLGGVCNGLATFLDIDPVWVRLSFFIPLLLLIMLSPFVWTGIINFLATLFATFALLYVILWFAIPQARTPRQKLEMSGRRITASSISDTAAGNTYSETTKQKSESVFSELFTLLGRIILIFIKVILLIFGFSLAVGAIGLLIGMFSTAFLPNLIDGEVYHVFAGLEGVSIRGLVIMAMAIAFIPMAMFVWLILRVVFNLRPAKGLMWSLFAIWIVLVVYTGVIAVKNHERIISNVEYRYHRGGYLWEKASGKIIDPVVIKGDTVLRGGTIDDVKEKLKGVESVTYRDGKLQTVIDGEEITIDIKRKKFDETEKE